MFRNMFLSCFKVILCLVVMATSFDVLASDRKALMTIDSRHLNPTRLEMKKALMRSLLHYNWSIKNHTQDSLRVSYKNTVLDITIVNQSLKIVSASDKALERQFSGSSSTDVLFNTTIGGEQIDAGWLQRLKQLYLRELVFFTEVRKAESFE